MRRVSLRKATLRGELLHPGKYLAAPELVDGDMVLTIDSVEIDELERVDGKKTKKERAPVMNFRETDKQLVLNRTNEDTLVGLYGTKAEAWAGKRVALYAARVMAFGEMVDAVRIRDKAPAGGTAPKADDPRSQFGRALREWTGIRDKADLAKAASDVKKRLGIDSAESTDDEVGRMLEWIREQQELGVEFSEAVAGDVPLDV